MEEKEKLDVVDIEEYAREGKPVPDANSYRIRVDRQNYLVHSPTFKGQAILELAGKTPQSHKLYQHKRGQQPVQIGPEQVVDLREPGVERFTTMPKDTTEGLVSQNLRRQFQLPQDDVRYLEGLGLPWEAVLDGGSQWLLVHKWKVREGYNHGEVSLALLIPPSYSDSQIDMVYFNPGLSRVDGRSINALSSHTILGAEWQRWSRHRTGSNPWRPGEDDVASHLCLVDDWLGREFGG